MSAPSSSASSGSTHPRVEAGAKKIASSIDSLSEPRRHAQEQLDAALREWRLLTPHHHLLTYSEEVEYLNTEWKHYRQACEAMETRLAPRSKRRIGRSSGASNSDITQLERLRAQLAAIEVRLKVLESQRKASGVVDVLPTDVEYAGKNLQAAQEWLTTLDGELDELIDLREQVTSDKVA